MCIRVYLRPAAILRSNLVFYLRAYTTRCILIASGAQSYDPPTSLSGMTKKYFQCTVKMRTAAWLKKLAYFNPTQLKTLTHAVQTAKANAANAQAAANGAQKTLRDKEELVDAAKRRVEELSNQLRAAKQELANTNRAAAKANAAANEAKANASRNKRRLENIRRMRIMKRWLIVFFLGSILIDNSSS